MDQIKIGKFIAACRKEQNMTQAALAEKLDISDRAVSKWETGKSMPDTGIMLELCELLHINVNELLSGERIEKEAYDDKAETNLLELRRELENRNRQFLHMELTIGIPVTCIALLLLIMAKLMDMSMSLRITLIVIGFVLSIVMAVCCVEIEQKAGYYECQNCHYRYMPTYKRMLMAQHMGRTRYMKCPKCGKKTWQKKVLTKEE